MPWNGRVKAMKIVPRLDQLHLVLGFALTPAPVAAQLELQSFFGSSVSAPSPISISQEGAAGLHFTGHWATRPYQDTWYYAGRIGLWRGARGWLLDFTHHKIYLTNPPDEVQQFQITNGMNMFTISRGFRRGKFSYAFGAGPVVTFPISSVRGRRLRADRGFLGGYFLSGGNLMASATRRFPLLLGFSLLVDGRASASYVRVPVAQGRASVPNFAMHLHFGLGYATPTRGKRRTTP